MKLRNLGIWGIVVAVLFLTATAVMSNTWIFTTKILHPIANQGFRGDVPLKVSVEVTPALPSMYFFMGMLEFEYLDKSSWVAKDIGNSTFLMNDYSHKTKIITDISIPQANFKGLYGTWRVRAKSATVTSGDPSPWSNWRQFQVIDPAAPPSMPKATIPSGSLTPPPLTTQKPVPKPGISVPGK